MTIFRRLWRLVMSEYFFHHCLIVINLFIYHTQSFLNSHHNGVLMTFLFLRRCNCSPEWSGTLCTVRYDDCRNAGQDLCVHGTCIDADRVVPGQVTSLLNTVKKYIAEYILFSCFFFTTVSTKHYLTL